MPKVPEHLGPSSSSEFHSRSIANNPDATPPQTSQKMHAKHKSKENHKKKRKAECELANRSQSACDYKPRPNIGRNHVKGCQPLKTEFDRSKISITKMAYTGLHSDKSAM